MTLYIILSGKYGFWQEICFITDGHVTGNLPMGLNYEHLTYNKYKYSTLHSLYLT